MSHDPNAGRCLCLDCVRAENLRDAAEELREAYARIRELEGLVEGNRLAGAEWRQRAEAYAKERDRAIARVAELEAELARR